MDCLKTGELIRRFRKEHKLTQMQLANKIGVSDKAVSKWERGLGCPDVSLLPDLSKILGVNLSELLLGVLDVNDSVGGNMKKLKFYVCPECGNILTSTSQASITCCGKSLQASAPCKADESRKLSVEKIENDYFISSSHEMKKEHHISFIAFLTGDSVIIKKLYPEWSLQTRIPCYGHGILVWHCTHHGAFYQLI